MSQNPPSCGNCILNSCVVYAKASQSSVPSPQRNGEENVILFDYITGTFFLDKCLDALNSCIVYFFRGKIP